MEISLPFDIPAHTAVAIREDVPVAEIASFFERTYALLGQVLGQAQLRPAAVRGYYLAPPSATFDVAAAFVIPTNARPAVADIIAGSGFADQGVVLLDFPRTRAVKTVVMGDYAKLGPAWEEFCTKIVRDGYTPGAWTCEDYITMPGEVELEDVRTELVSAIM